MKIYTRFNITEHPRYKEAFGWASSFYGSGVDQIEYLEGAVDDTKGGRI